MEDYLFSFCLSHISLTSLYAQALQISSVDSIMIIDPDTTEKRESAAIIIYHAIAQAAKEELWNPTLEKRLSWTGLTVFIAQAQGDSMNGTGNQQNARNAEMIGLKMVRIACKSCGGLRGRDVDWLARYVVRIGDSRLGRRQGGLILKDYEHLFFYASGW
jgi:hypothetical protein